MKRGAWDRLSDADRKAFRRAADKAYRTMGATMNHHFDEMTSLLAQQGSSSRLLTTAEFDNFAQASRVSEVQDAWAQSHATQHEIAAISVLARVRELWRRAMARER